MSRSTLAVSNGSRSSSSQPPDESSAGNVYTMAEAARLKGVSYHTVSRAVRRGKLPAKRLGRMALIRVEDLRAWRPMRERAPLKYRRREPNPDATPALLDLASEERVELAERLSLLFEIIHGAASDLPKDEFLALLADRTATALDLRRVAIWEFDADGTRATRVAAFGPALSEIPAVAATSDTPALAHAASATGPELLDVDEAFSPDPRRKVKRGAKVFVTPLRSGQQTLGAIVGDQLGNKLAISPVQLSLAQGMASQAAIVLDCTRMRAVDETHTRQLESAAARAAAVGEVALAANSGTDLATVLRTAITGMTDLLGGVHGAIFFREADGRLTGQIGYRTMESLTDGLTLDPQEIPATMLSFSRRSPVYTTYDSSSPTERAHYDMFGLRASIIAPLMTGEEIIGVAYVNYERDDRRPSNDEMNFAGALANQCAVAIEKARLMDRLESAHRRLLAVVDQLPQGVVIVDAPNGHLILANRAAEELWGAPLPEVGSNALALADATGAPFAPGENPLNLTMSTGQGRIGETMTLTRADGTRVTVLANHAPVVDAAGRIMGAVSVLQNIAQLRALDRAKDEFLSVAAHELRNPLTSLHGNLQLLLRHVQKDPERAEDATRLEAIISQSDRLAQLVGRLLDVSRAELGRLDLEVEKADAAAIVRRVVDGARGLSTAHRIRADAPESVLVAWDALRIEQVLTNLVGNAVKYTSGGDVVVTLEETSDDLVRISVRDHGAGIQRIDKSNIFERYVRANGEIQSEGDGLGLGLYISRLIARAHGGDLTLHDAPGGGALFVIAIPRRADVSGTIQLQSPSLA